MLLNKDKILLVSRNNLNFHYHMDDQLLQDIDCEKDLAIDIHNISQTYCREHLPVVIKKAT